MAGETGEATTLTFEQRLAGLTATAGALAVAQTEASEAKSRYEETRDQANALEISLNDQTKKAAAQIVELAISGELVGEDLYEAVGKFASAVSGEASYTNFDAARDYRSQIIPGELVLRYGKILTLVNNPHTGTPSVIPVLENTRHKLAIEFETWAVGDNDQPGIVTLSPLDPLGKDNIENHLDQIDEEHRTNIDTSIWLAETYAVIGKNEKAKTQTEKVIRTIKYKLDKSAVTLRPTIIRFLQDFSPEEWQKIYDRVAKGAELTDRFGVTGLMPFVPNLAEARNPNFGQLPQLEQNRLVTGILVELNQRAQELDKQDSADASETKE